MDVTKRRTTSVGRGPMSPHSVRTNNIGETGGVRDGVASVVLEERPNLAQTRNVGLEGSSSPSIGGGLKVVTTADRKISRP